MSNCADGNARSSRIGNCFPDGRQTLEASNRRPSKYFCIARTKFCRTNERLSSTRYKAHNLFDNPQSIDCLLLSSSHHRRLVVDLSLHQLLHQQHFAFACLSCCRQNQFPTMSLQKIQKSSGVSFVVRVRKGYITSWGSRGEKSIEKLAHPAYLDMLPISRPRWGWSYLSLYLASQT